MIRIAAFLAVWLFAATALGRPVQPGGSAMVTQVIDGDTVVLGARIDGSDRVRLVGIQAPKLPLGRKNFKAWPLADKARTALEKLLVGKIVTLKFGGRRMDRHGRLLAHLYTDDGGWIQGRMLLAGMARVYSFPDNRALVANMLALESQARQARRGIWAEPFYAVRPAAGVDRLIGTFQLVEGTVQDAQTVRGRTYLNFAADWRSDFTITIDRRARKSFTALGIDPLAMKGRTVRVRGWINKRNGPMIEVSHPEQIEIIDR